MRYAICYVSTASDGLNSDIIKDLLSFTTQYNNDNDIRGILLYAEGNFFQVLEGEKSIVGRVYEKIQKDSRHRNIIQVVGKDLDQGAFDGYKAEMVIENKKYDSELIREYMKQVKGLDSQTQGVVKRIMEVFIDTH